jgi:ribosomal protein L40E
MGGKSMPPAMPDYATQPDAFGAQSVCHGCGAPLPVLAMTCDYCQRPRLEPHEIDALQQFALHFAPAGCGVK